MHDNNNAGGCLSRRGEAFTSSEHNDMKKNSIQLHIFLTYISLVMSEGRRKENKKRNMNANLVRILNHSSVQDADLVVTGDITIGIWP